MELELVGRLSQQQEEVEEEEWDMEEVQAFDNGELEYETDELYAGGEALKLTADDEAQIAPHIKPRKSRTESMAAAVDSPAPTPLSDAALEQAEELDDNDNDDVPPPMSDSDIDSDVDDFADFGGCGDEPAVLDASMIEETMASPRTPAVVAVPTYDSD